MTDKQALLRAAVKVGAHTWEAEGSRVWSMSNGTADCLVLEVFGDETSGQQDCDIASFIAESSPANILALLDELKESQALVANESACADSTINLAINWQMRCKNAEAKLEAAEKRIAELEARSFNPAILDVISERQRQQSVEGWTPEHDNAYQNSELADAAACYAIHAHNQGFSTPAHWPWSPDWWKQSGARRDLVKAGALILAEIERIDRAAGIGVKGD
ncbi:ead/Ea22-like family protein [Citrobacter freundii]|uniref:ead/Ea22-like family protein n=1 Tax=Citrobacter freundii TaxID=546 RepID=UPI000E1D2C35|nr:ead/Ea22-like family protein [Citrobacter freundii]RDT35831.1 ead/Ea22-like family protein [Citrobacter freundii]